MRSANELDCFPVPSSHLGTPRPPEAIPPPPTPPPPHRTVTPNLNPDRVPITSSLSYSTVSTWPIIASRKPAWWPLILSMTACEAQTRDILARNSDMATGGSKSIVTRSRRLLASRPVSSCHVMFTSRRFSSRVFPSRDIHDIPPVVPSSMTTQTVHSVWPPPAQQRSTASCCSTRTDSRPAIVPTCEARSRVRLGSRQDPGPGFNIHASTPWHPFGV